MRRSFRTRRLSLTAMVSLLAFVAVAELGIKSLWISDGWFDRNGHVIGVFEGCAVYSQITTRFNGLVTSGHYTVRKKPDRHVLRTAISGFSATKIFLPNPRVAIGFEIVAPLWPLLLLLLIAPVRWLIARPVNTQAFPVITKQP